jgi:hypothetical protein
MHTGWLMVGSSMALRSSWMRMLRWRKVAIPFWCTTHASLWITEEREPARIAIATTPAKAIEPISHVDLDIEKQLAQIQ